MSHRQPDQDAGASAPNEGGPRPPPRGPPLTGKEAGLGDGGKRPRPNLIHTYIPKRANNGILVDYPDSSGSDSPSPAQDQASPEGRPGSDWPVQTPVKSGPNESDPDFPDGIAGSGSGSKLGAGREGAQDLDSGFKSVKSVKFRSFGSPCSSVDMFLDSSQEPKRVGVDSDSDSDLIPNSLAQITPPSRIPILRLNRLPTSPLSDLESSQVVGRKRKGGQVILSSSSGSGSASELDDGVGGGVWGRVFWRIESRSGRSKDTRIWGSWGD